MSSTFGPLDHYPGIMQRSPGLIDLQVQLRDRPNVVGLRLWASLNPHHLYGTRAGAVSGMGGAAPVANNARRRALLQGRPGRFSTSTSILTTKGLRYSEVIRGTTRFIFDLDDFPIAAPSQLPTDDQMLFVAIQQERIGLPSVLVDGFTGRANRVKGAVDTGDPILGPILCIPTALQMSMPETTLVISGDAPQLGAGLAMPVMGNFPVPFTDLQLPNPLHIVLPRPTTSITVRNNDGVTGLRVSYGLGQQVFEIPVSGERTHFGAVKDICLMSAAAGALASFSLEANINFGGTASGIG
jgi:hypothetical protein